MRTTLRRSCDLCARSKLRCDLQLPQCSRCQKKSPTGIICVYANTPSTTSTKLSSGSDTGMSRRPLSFSLTGDLATTSKNQPPGPENAMLQRSVSPQPISNNPGTGTFDPFDSYPRTRLPRALVSRLIQHFLSTIAFQYYPLDLQAKSNPFVVSWFPLALADPALFHVSLQTASLDVDLRAQKGFANSDILMADSVSLVRLKVEDPVLAIQDETMDAVVTLAAIEFGKGNTDVGRMHIDGIKSMVRVRGGIQQLKETSPLTARMIAWVSMIVMQTPQFPTQDDSGQGDGIAPIAQWIDAANEFEDWPSSLLDVPCLDPIVNDIICRLRALFYCPERFNMSTNDFHDLACFAIHRLLEPQRPILQTESPAIAISGSFRLAITLYLLVLHGPTYFSHAALQYTLVQNLRAHLEACTDTTSICDPSVAVWLLSIGMVASNSTSEFPWFTSEAGKLATTLAIYSWPRVLPHLKKVLWMDKVHTEQVFSQSWENVWPIVGI